MNYQGTHFRQPRKKKPGSCLLCVFMDFLTVPNASWGCQHKLTKWTGQQVVLLLSQTPRLNTKPEADHITLVESAWEINNNFPTCVITSSLLLTSVALPHHHTEGLWAQPTPPLGFSCFSALQVLVKACRSIHVCLGPVHGDRLWGSRHISSDPVQPIYIRAVAFAIFQLNMFSCMSKACSIYIAWFGGNKCSPSFHESTDFFPCRKSQDRCSLHSQVAASLEAILGASFPGCSSVFPPIWERSCHLI